MARYKLTIAYDGRPFAGWQSQLRVTTIQDVIEKAIASLSGAEGTRIHGSSRTDRAVHALGQVAHFDAPEGTRLSEMDWHRALNAMLPPTIRIMRCERVADDFHARFQARGKIYRYRLWHGEVLPPLEHGLAWHLHGCLDELAIRRAALLFEGTHDFSAFSALRREPDEETANKVRTIHRVSVSQQGELMALTFEGDGFLYKMVRMIVGAIVQVARGRQPLERLGELLAEPQQQKPGWQAPPDGLTLVQVLY